MTGAERDGRAGPGPVEEFDRDYSHVAAMLAGQLITDERWAKADTAYWLTNDGQPTAHELRLRAALVAIAPDIAAEVERRVLDRCAAELRALLAEVNDAMDDEPPIEQADIHLMADRWSSSGRAPADDERQR